MTKKKIVNFQGSAKSKKYNNLVTWDVSQNRSLKKWRTQSP